MSKGSDRNATAHAEPVSGDSGWDRLQVQASRGRSISDSLTIREFVSGDLPAVLDLLNGCFATPHTADWWHWKYDANVFGKSIILVAETEGRIVGLRGFWRWDFLRDGQVIKAVQSVDTCVHAAYRRRGIFTQLVLAALERAQRAGVQMVFNFPGRLSLPGYLKLGWRYVKRVSWYGKLLRPWAIGAKCLRPSDRVGSLLEAHSAMTPADIEDLRIAPGTSGMRTHISPAFLRWRYLENPLHEYGIVKPPAGQIDNVGIYRFGLLGSLREVRLIDVLNFNEDDWPCLLKRLTSTGRSLRADYILIPELGFPHMDRVARRHLFFRVPRKGFNLVCRSTAPEIDMALPEYRNWLITPGSTDTY